MLSADMNAAVFIDANTDSKRVVAQRRKQSAESIPLPKVLIDDESIRQAEARTQRHHASAGVPPVDP